MKYILTDMQQVGVVTLNIPCADDIMEVDRLSNSIVVAMSPLIRGGTSQISGSVVLNSDYFPDGARFFVPHSAYTRLESQFETIVRECIAKFRQLETAVA